MSLPAGGGGYASAPADIHAYNVRTGALQWIFHTVPRPGEFGADTWPEGGLGNYGGVHNWSESTVDAETRHHLRADGHGTLRLLRRQPPRRESVRQQPARARRAQRQAALALPDDPSRSLGLRPADGAEAADRRARRRLDSGHRATEQARLRLRLQSHHGRAALADRRAPRAAVRHARAR